MQVPFNYKKLLLDGPSKNQIGIWVRAVETYAAGITISGWIQRVVDTDFPSLSPCPFLASRNGLPLSFSFLEFKNNNLPIILFTDNLNRYHPNGLNCTYTLQIGHARGTLTTKTLPKGHPNFLVRDTYPVNFPETIYKVVV